MNVARPAVTMFHHVKERFRYWTIQFIGGVRDTGRYLFAGYIFVEFGHQCKAFRFIFLFWIDPLPIDLTVPSGIVIRWSQSSTTFEDVESSQWYCWYKRTRSAEVEPCWNAEACQKNDIVSPWTSTSSVYFDVPLLRPRSYKFIISHYCLER